MQVEYLYNIKSSGPQVSTWGDKPFLLYFYNIINGKKVQTSIESFNPSYFTRIGRQWFTNWRIEIYEWVGGNLEMVSHDEFNPAYKTTHFYLESGNYSDCLEYVRACLDYVKKWEIKEFLIETSFWKEINRHFEISNSVANIENPGNCYVNYTIRKSPSYNATSEIFGVPGLLVEDIVFNDVITPISSADSTPYELARAILFGPDYKTSNKFVPYNWLLKERIVS